METPKFDDIRDDWKIYFAKFMADNHGIIVEKPVSAGSSVSKIICDLYQAHENAFMNGIEYIKYGIACGAIKQEHIDMWRESLQKEQEQPND